MLIALTHMFSHLTQLEDFKIKVSEIKYVKQILLDKYRNIIFSVVS